MTADGGEPFLRDVDAAVSINIIRVKADLDSFLNTPCVPVLIPRYAAHPIPIGRVICAPSMLSNCRAIYATVLDISAVL